MLGTYALSSGYKDAYYLKALKVRRLIKDDFDQAFAECDVVMGPTSPTAGVQDRREGRRPAGDVPVRHLHDQLPTWPASPGISIPCGFTKAGLPIGLQILAAPFEEEKLLRIARMYERETDWHTKRPKF